MNIQTFALGPLETNCYLLHQDGEAVVIDPGGEVTSILKYLEAHKLRLVGIYNTHMHFDHIYGNAALQKTTGAPIHASAADHYLLEGAYGRGGEYGMPNVSPFSYEPLEAGTLSLLGESCTVLHTPGHSRGSLSFHWPSLGAVFVGDVLFYLSAGRTDLPGGDSEVLRASIQDVLFALPLATTVYPGHGPDTSIEAERIANPYFGLGR